MTFEEFFKKKRIDLAAFEKGEPGLFFEFRKHFEQMGEKSFDHTKKYWFNNLRRQYHLAPEIKPEKPKFENPIAEQTVYESLTEVIVDSHVLGAVPQVKAEAIEAIEDVKKHTDAAPKPGFTPRFKAANLPKQAEPAAAEEKKEEPATPAPKLGFTPKFKAGITKPAEAPSAEEKKEEPAAPAPKLGFTPKFKAGITKPAEAPSAEEKKEESAAPAPKLGFTPKFKAGVTKPAAAPVEEKAEDIPSPETKTEETPVNAPPKLGFKPKFKPSTPPKPEGED